MTNYKVGDPDTTPDDRVGDGCDTTDGNFWCTRELDHIGQHAAGDGTQIVAVWGDPEPKPTGGVWAIVYRDYYELIEKVYPTEIEALRAINGAGHGTVKFLPWGKALNEIEEEW